MDVLFLNPRTELADTSKIFHREPPNGLLTLCAILENAGFDVDFIDLSYKKASELKKALVESPKIVGISSLTNTYHRAMIILKQVKEIFPEVKTLYGGPHATFKYAEVLRENDYVDYILCGEADRTIIQFVNTIINERGQIDGSKIPNLAFRKDGKIKIFKKYLPINLNEVPLPARHLLNLREYQVGTIIVNRGCSFNCTFCVRQKIFQKVRLREMKSIVHEIGILSNLGFEFVNLYDNLNISEEYCLKLCKNLTESQISLPWGCELRADRITVNLASALNAAGCKVAAVGIESGDSHVLKMANKVQDIEEVKKGINALKSMNIAIQAYFIAGLPGETEKSFEKTLQLIKELKLEPGFDRVNFFAATPYPGTALYEFPDKYNVKILHEDWDLYDNSHIIMALDTLPMENLIKNFERGKEIEREFTSS
ncbi:MAG: radical SAM protein [Promethearchaeota archaeon]|nr:MAG: radical SAM protein [Candidatus Lokiarchaeota archaeon]